LRHAQLEIEAGERGLGRIERGERTVGDGDQETGHDLLPASHPRSTSGLMQFGGTLPSMSARMLSTTMLAMRSRHSTTPLPRYGVVTTLGIASNAAATLGSCSNTSRPAPAICRFFKACTSAASSTMAPRAVLMRKAVGFIKANSRRPI